MADVIATLRASISDFTAKMQTAREEMAETDAASKEMSDSGSSNMSKLSTLGGAALLGLGAAVIGVGAVSVDLGMKFQATTATIAANAGISTQAAAKIGTAFLNTAGTTIYSGQQIATAYAAVAGQLGQTQGKALDSSQAMQVMRAAMDLAEGSGTDLGTATSALAATMQSFQVKANGAVGVSNVLFNAARLTGTGVDALSSALDKARTRLGGMAPPIQDLGGLLVDMASHGETGRQAMSALTTSFTAFLKPATDAATAQATLRAATEALPPSLQGLAAAVTNGTMSSTAATTAAQGLGTAQAALFSKFVSATGAAATAGEAQAKMGINALTASGQMKPLGDIIGQLHTQIAGMGTAAATAQLSADGFGSSAAKMVSVVQAGPAAFDKDTAAVSRANSAHEAAEKQSQTLSHQIETLKAQAEDYATKLGVALIPKLQDLMKIVMSVVEWFGKHKVAAIALAAIIGGVLLAATIAWVVSLFMADGALNFLISPITLVVAGVALLALGFYELYKHVAPVRDLFRLMADYFKLIWDAITTEIKVALDIIIGIAKVFIDLFTGNWSGAWNAIRAMVTQVWNAIVGFFGGIPAKLVGALASFGGDLLKWITDAWKGLVSWITEAVNLYIQWWILLPVKVIAALIQFAPMLINWITVAWNQLVAWVTGAFGAWLGWWLSLPSKVVSALSALGGDLLSWIETAWGNVTSGLASAWGATASWLSNLPHLILTTIGDIGSYMEQVGKAIIDGIVHGIESAVGDVTSALNSVVNTIKSIPVIGKLIGSPSPYFTEVGAAMGQGLVNGLLGSSGQVTAATKALGNAATASLQGSLTANVGVNGLGANSGISPSFAPASGQAGALAGGSSQPIYLQVNGNTFATLMLPFNQIAALQAQRGTSVPVFGTVQ